MRDTVIIGDCREVLRTLPDSCVHCCISSPPYWGLRDYGTAKWEGGDEGCDHVTAEIRTQYRDICSKCGAHRVDSQIGLERTPEAYVAEMVEVFREVRRVLRDDGILWLNLGDSYAGSGPSGASYQSETTKRRLGGDGVDGAFRVSKRLAERGLTYSQKKPIPPPGLKPKDLVGIPWRVAFALQADGWWLRQDIIWSKLNPMPESVTDRCTKAHEYVFLLAKSEKYFYDAEAVKEESSESSMARAKYNGEASSPNPKNILAVEQGVVCGSKSMAKAYGQGRNRRSVWTIATQPYTDAHFAVFPEKLVEPMIKAGCPAKCCPKCGMGWERVVERTDELDTSAKGSTFDGGKTGARDGGDRTQPGPRFKTRGNGFRPACTCNVYDQHLPPDDPANVPYPPVPGVVLDPFAGSGTTLAVAARLGRSYIGIELNSKYEKLIKDRLNPAIEYRSQCESFEIMMGLPAENE